jgi:ABC-2 type transport system ATP-binding protein
MRPDGGKVLVDGMDPEVDPRGVKAKLGSVPQETAIYEELTARENLRFWAGLHGLRGTQLKSAVDEVLEQVGLTERADSRAKSYSGGMKRRLNLGLGLVHRPQVVLLDEPTVGIDPQARQRILDVVQGVASNGTTIVYTTHYLEEAERLCDRIGIIDHGKIIADGTIEELERMVGREDVITVRGSFDPEQVRQRLDGVDSARVLASDEGRIVLAATGGGEAAVRLLTSLLDGQLKVEGISIQPPGLNGLFLKLTGRELRD